METADLAVWFGGQPMSVDYVYMLLILLIPIIPAFILFRFLPSSANVKGPLKGLDIKLGGAFGGYIVAVILSWRVALSLLTPTWSDNWNVVAHVKFAGPEGNHPSPTEAIVLVRPPAPDIGSDGVIQLRIAIPRVHMNSYDLQRLVVAHDGYETVTVPLDPDQKHLASYGGEDYQVRFDAKKKEITVTQPIVLTKAAQ
jgi:hypothetical protein